MAGLFNSFYYGKAGKADFTPEQLPTNRVQLFFETLRVRFSGLVGMNLLYVLFSLPAILWTWINVQMVLSAETVAGAGAAVAITADQIPSVVMMYLLGMIPCLMLMGAIAPGTIYVLRNWARDQHSFTMSDFKDAVKGNWKHGLLTGLINGVSLVLTYVSYQYYGAQAAAQSVAWVIPQMFVVIVCALWWMVNMVIFPMMVTYDMKFSQLVRNSFIIVLARLPWSVLIWGLSLAIPLLIAYFVPYGVIAVLLVYLVLGFTLTFFVYVSYANSCFDRFLNPRIEGAPVNMGLRDPAYDDEDDEDEENAGKPGNP